MKPNDYRSRTAAERYDEYKRRKPEAKQERPRLTHKLKCNSAQVWSCACGYTLGDGHDKLYALCPLWKREAYNEFNISFRDHEKKKTKPSQRKAGRATRGVSQAATDLFELS
jgi:hypothetical protein